MSGGSNVDWSTIGQIAGAGIGLALAPATGGASLLAAGALGASLGGAAGSLLEGPAQGPNTDYMNPGAGERELEARLAQQASGQGPSVAVNQLQAGLDQSNSNAMALAASQRGISPGLAAALAQRQQGLNQMETNQQAGLMRAQEALGANQLQASLYSSQRGSAAQAAQLQQQAAMAQNQQFNNLLSSAGQAALTYGMMGKKNDVSTQAGGGGGMANSMNKLGAPVGAAPVEAPIAAAPITEPNPERMAALRAGLGSGKSPMRASTPKTAEAYSRKYFDDQARQAMGNAKFNSNPIALSSGGKVPGKANVKGDSPTNDTVIARLSPGEMVIPRTVVQQGPEAVSAFAQALMKGQKNA